MKSPKGTEYRSSRLTKGGSTQWTVTLPSGARTVVVKKYSREAGTMLYYPHSGRRVSYGVGTLHEVADGLAYMLRPNRSTPAPCTSNERGPVSRVPLEGLTVSSAFGSAVTPAITEADYQTWMRL